jgi:DHA2 family multidrug resistance protein
MTPALPMTEGRRILITAGVCLCTVMQTLDATIANVALPYMQGSLSASQDQVAWVITSYMVSSAIMTAVSAYLADRFGRKAVFITSIIAFTLTSVMCGASATLSEIVLFRVLQGAAGASVVPLSQALIISIWPDEKRGMAQAWWSMGVMLSPIIGPSLGGYLTDVLSWRWVFLVNLPIGIICTLAMMVLLPDSPRDTRKRMNVPGFAYLAIALGSLQLMLDRGQTLDWFESREVIVEALISIVTFYLFVVDTVTSRQPFLDGRVFRDNNYLAGSVLGTLSGGVLASTMVLWPTMLESLMGYPVMSAAVLMMPRGIAALIAMGVAGRLVTQVGARKLIALGIVISASGFVLASHLTLDGGEWPLILIGTVHGVGMGFIFVPITTMTYETLDRRYLNHATVFYSLGRNVGNGVGTSLVVTLFLHLSAVNHASLVANITPFSAGTRSLISGAASAVVDTSKGALAMLEGEISRQAAMTAYCSSYLILAYGMAALALLLLISRPSKRRLYDMDVNVVHEV